MTRSAHLHFTYTWRVLAYRIVKAPDVGVGEDGRCSAFLFPPATLRLGNAQHLAFIASTTTRSRLPMLWRAHWHTASIRISLHPTVTPSQHPITTAVFNTIERRITAMHCWVNINVHLSTSVATRRTCVVESQRPLESLTDGTLRRAPSDPRRRITPTSARCAFKTATP